MSRRGLRLLTLSVPAVLLTWLGLGLPGATTQKDAAEKSRDEAAAPAPRTLLMMVRVSSDLDSERISKTLQKGMELSGCKGDKPLIEHIPSTVFRLLSRETSSTAPDLEGGDNKELTIRAMPEFPSAWLLKLTAPLKEIQEIEVEYIPSNPPDKTSNPTAKKTLKPGDLSKDADTPFYQMSTRPVMYQLRLSEDMRPTSVAVTTREFNTKKVVKKDYPWPSATRHYMISILNFVGKHQDLFDTIKKRKDGVNLVPDPVDDLAPATELTVALASWGALISQPNEGFGEVHYTAMVDAPGDRKDIKRVWIYFPLTEKDKRHDTALAEWRQHRDEMLCKRIRDSRPSYAATEKDLELDPGMQPRWIELPPDGQGKFARRMQVKDWKKIQATMPKVWQLVVWEYETDKVPPNPVYAYDAKAQKSFQILRDELKRWPEGVASVAKDTKNPTR